MPEIKKAVIAAAGFGSRFLPITKSIPKEMLPIIDKPIIHYLVEECAEAGIEEVIIVAAPDEVTTFENYFYGRATQVRTLMIQQEKMDRWAKVEKIFNLPLITVLAEDRSIPYGNGRPFLSAKDLVGKEEAFVALFGDDVVLSETSAVSQMVAEFQNNPCNGLLAVQEMPDDQLHRYGIVSPREGVEGVVDGIVEKPETGTAPSNLADFGRFILTPELFDHLQRDSVGKDNEVWLIDAIVKIIQQGGTVRYKHIDGEWLTTGDPLNYLKAQLKFSLKLGGQSEELLDYLSSVVNE